MKRNIITTALILSPLLMVSHTFAADGTVHYRGEITDAACEVKGGTTDQYVDLGKISKGTFEAAGDLSGPQRFDIELVNCPATYNLVGIKFSGPEASNNAGDLAIGDPVETNSPGDYTGQGTALAAENVAIRIYNRGDMSQLELEDNSTKVAIDAGNATIPFVARYIALSNNVTPGTANANAQFTVEYFK